MRLTSAVECFNNCGDSGSVCARKYRVRFCSAYAALNSRITNNFLVLTKAGKHSARCRRDRLAKAERGCEVGRIVSTDVFHGVHSATPFVDLLIPVTDINHLCGLIAQHIEDDWISVLRLI